MAQSTCVETPQFVSSNQNSTAEEYSCISPLPDSVCSRWWRAISPFLWTPRSVDQLVTVLLWHSLLLTFTTLFFRLFNDHWRGESSLHWLISLLASPSTVRFLENTGFIHFGIDYAAEGAVPINSGPMPVQGMDLAFGLHAVSALTWLSSAYVQMVHTRRFNAKAHRNFGSFSLLSFCCHIGSAMFVLYSDLLRHKTLPKIILFSIVTSSVRYMVQAMRLVMLKRKPKGFALAHQDLIFLLFAVSLSGAGSIRMVAHVQQWLGCGPVHCQAEHGGMATACMWPYVLRFFVIQAVTLYNRGLYCKVRNDAELT